MNPNKHIDTVDPHRPVEHNLPLFSETSRDEQARQMGRFVEGFKAEKLARKERKRESNREYREKNKSRIAENNKQYRAKNRQEIAECKRLYYIKNKEKIIAHRAKHKEYRSKQWRCYYLANRDRLLLCSRINREKNSKAIAEYNRQYAIDNPEKTRARGIVRCAIMKGALLRRPCVKCGELPADAHHPDYSKPLDVVWLCRSHHKKLHEDEKQNRINP